MDIHRCRFVEYNPSTINVLAFSHTSIPENQQKVKKSLDSLRLAVGRANGDIEIWNPLNGTWVQESVLRGGEGRSIDGLCWTQDPVDKDAEDGQEGRLRLFSVGDSTTVTEWDLEKGCARKQASGNHGEILCLSAQPAVVKDDRNKMKGVNWRGWNGQNLITGCTDGSLVLYSTQDEELNWKRIIARPSTKRAKIISVVWKNRDIVVAGCTDSVIRVYDTRSTALLRTMSLGGGPKGGPKNSFVWSVNVLPNGDIVSGDSTGALRIWDGKTYTLMQTINAHKQDILSIATSLDGSMIFSGGMDKRTVAYKKVGRDGHRWAEASHRRFQKHDVKTMATFEGNGMSIIASGGPDTTPVIVPLKEFGRENHRALPNLPQQSIVHSAPSKRLMMSWWDREVHIWRIGRHFNESRRIAVPQLDSDASPKNRKLVAKIYIKGEASITSASLSPTCNGSILAVSTTVETKLFQLRDRPDSDSLQVSKINVPTRLASSGANIVQFSPDSHWLCVTHGSNSITLARVWQQPLRPIQIFPQLTHLRRIRRKTASLPSDSNGLGTYTRTISLVAFSSDSRILAVSDLSGYIDTYVLSGHFDAATTTPEEISQLLESSASSPDASDSDDSSSSDDDEEDPDEEETPATKSKHTKQILGQNWHPSPSATLLPKMPAAPTVLSFRPAKPGANDTATNGLSPHPTRNTPKPVAHDLPTGEDRLLAIVPANTKSPASHNTLYELEVLKGSLSTWARNNMAVEKWPHAWKVALDVAMGVLWDISAHRERVWVYSSSWLFMVDLSRDLPDLSKEGERKAEELALTAAAEAGTLNPKMKKRLKQLKRKREARGEEMAVKKTSGAGGLMAVGEEDTGVVGRKMLVVEEARREPREVRRGEEMGKVMSYPKNTKTKARSVALFDGADEREDEFDDDESFEGFADSDVVLVEGEDDGEGGEGKKGLPNGGSKKLHFWHTFKYRPILGIVECGRDARKGLEVALVERPLWDVELPPRDDGEEWE